MKNKLLLLFILFSHLTMANVSKVYIAVGNEPLGTTPVHGSASWSTYIGTAKLAFAKGYQYKMKIEYSGIIPPGIIKSSSTSAIVTNVVQEGKTFTFNLSIPETATRLANFQLSYAKSGVTLLFPIPCEVVEIGRFFSLLVKDTTNTLMTTYAAKTEQLISMSFVKNTGKKYFTFYGSDLQHAKFIGSLNNGQSAGLIFSLKSVQSVSNTQISVEALVAATPASGGKLAADVLSRMIDSAADRHFPWVTYQYARKMAGGSGIQSTLNATGSGIINAGTTLFEVLPGQSVSLTSGLSGFHDFLSAGYNIN